MKNKSIVLTILSLSTVCFVGVLSGHWLEQGLGVDSGCEYVGEPESMIYLSAAAARRPHPSILPVYIDCFDDSSEWTSLYNLTISDVSEFEGQKAYLCGNKNFSSILVTHLPGSDDYSYSRMRKEFAEPKDFSGCHIAFRLKVIEGESTSSYENIRTALLGFRDISGKSVWFRASRSWGWQEMRKTQTDFQEGDETIDWRYITQIGINFFANANTTPQIILDRLMIFKSVSSGALFEKPIVVNTFDDCWLSQYDAAAYLSGKGMFGTFYVIGNRVEFGYPEKLTLTQLQDMHWAGHLIANHTWSHPMPFDELSSAEQIREITHMQMWLCKNGFGDGARILATPGNTWNPRMERAAGPYVDQVREILGASGSCRNPIINPARIRVSANTPAGALAEVEKALTPDEPASIIVYMGHDMTESMIDFKAYVDYLEMKRNHGEINVRTSADLLAP